MFQVVWPYSSGRYYAFRSTRWSSRQLHGSSKLVTPKRKAQLAQAVEPKANTPLYITHMEYIRVAHNLLQNTITHIKPMCLWWCRYGWFFFFFINKMWIFFIIYFSFVPWILSSEFSRGIAFYNFIYGGNYYTILPM